MNTKQERRIWVDGVRLERRNADGRDFQTMYGHAAVFNKLSEDLFYFREKIKPGAFRNAIQQDDVRALFNHDSNFVLGRSKAGTLRLSEDDIGLAVEIDLPDTQLARDLSVSVDRGDVTQMSFGFQTIKDEWDYSDKDMAIRTLIEVKLFDVSPVTFPAYPDTDVAVRSLEAYRKSVPVPMAERQVRERTIRTWGSMLGL